ncbi:MAG TPA: ABC transporter permease [Usitatibacter sp.]|nr:ABC transporter permease [Usitatibacter sp.]
MDALTALIRKDLVLYFSNRRALLITLAAPILIAAFFGSVMGGTPKKPSKVPVAMVDQDGSAISKQILANVRKDTAFDLQEVDDAAATELVRKGKVRAAAVIPKGFGEDAPKAIFRPGAKKPQIVVRYDPSQAVALALVKGLLTEHVMSVVGKAAFDPASGNSMVAGARDDVMKSTNISAADRRDLVTLFDSIERLNTRKPAEGGSPGAATGMGGFSVPFETREAEVTGNLDRKYNEYSHSFAGMGVQFILFMGIEIGVGLLLMRRMGLWKRLRAAPVSRWLLLGSRVISGALIAAILLAAIYAAGIAIFGVRIEGSLAGFVLIAIAFAILTSTFGLLIASLGKTPEATRGLAILATLLLVMLGGAWVPSFVFPAWLQQVTLFVPTRWAVDGLEAMTWRGLGFEAAWPPALAMLAFSAVVAWIAVKRFSWEE